MRLFLLMLIVTTIEVILIAKVGNLIGFFPTFLIIIATALFGSWQLKQQWRFVMGKLGALQSEPSQALLEALVLVICGVLLITPGFLTDIVGFLGLIPVFRERFVKLLRKNAGKVMQGNFQMYTSQSAYYRDEQDTQTRTQNHQYDTQQNHQSGRIIEGEFERKDD